MAQSQPRNGITEAYKFAAVESSASIRRRLEANNKPISPLILAILNKDQEAVANVLLENAEGVNEQLDMAHDYTPLILACEYKMFDSIMKLVQEGADPKKMISFGNLTPLAVAIHSGELEIVQYLVEERGLCVSKKPPNGSGSDPLSPVHVACFYGKLDIVRFLVETYNVKLNMKDGYGVTPLILCLMMDQWEVANYLLHSLSEDGDVSQYTHELSINHKSVHWDTALTICMRKLKSVGRVAVDLASRMLDCGADPLIPTVKPNEQPESALSLAIRDADYDFAKKLVEKCQTLEQRGGSTTFAAALALKLALAREKRFSKLLLEKLRIDPNLHYTNTHDTCMHALGRILGGHQWTDNDYEEDMVRLFIRHGGDINGRNDVGETFLSLIANRRDVQSFVAGLTTRGGTRDSASRRLDGDDRPTAPNKKRANKQTSDLNTASSHSNKRPNKSSRKKSSKPSTTHPRTAPSSKRKKNKKKKQQQPPANGESKDDQKERENEASTKSNRSAVVPSPTNVDILDVPLSDLSGEMQSESEMTATSSSAVDDDSDGFRKVETRSARNKKKQQRQQQSNRSTGNRHNTGGKKSRRGEMTVPSSPRVRKQRTNTPASASRKPREKILPSSLPRKLSGKNPQQLSRRLVKGERLNEKIKPVRVHVASWATDNFCEALKKSKANGHVEQVNEPREVSNRDDEIPEPRIPARLLSPRDKTLASPGKRTPPPNRGRSPSFGKTKLTCNGNAEHDSQSQSQSADSRVTLGLEEEKSPSEKPGKPIAAPTRPPMPRPVKPPKFAGSSAVSLESVPSFHRPSPPHRVVMSSTQTHQFTVFPKETPHQEHIGSSEHETSGLQTDQSSKSGHSTEDIASGESSPSSSHQQSISVSIQTGQASPSTKMSVETGFLNEPTPTDKPATVEAVPDQQPTASTTTFTPQPEQTLHQPRVQSPLNPVANSFQFLPTQQAIPNPSLMATPLTVPNLGLHPPLGGFGFVQPGVIPNANFGGMHHIHPMLAATIPPGHSLAHMHPIPNMHQQAMHGMPQQHPVPMMPFQFPMHPPQPPQMQQYPHPQHIPSPHHPHQQRPPPHLQPQFQPMPMGHQQFHMGPQPNIMQPPPHQISPTNLPPQQQGFRHPQQRP